MFFEKSAINHSEWYETSFKYCWPCWVSPCGINYLNKLYRGNASYVDLLGIKRDIICHNRRPSKWMMHYTIQRCWVSYHVGLYCLNCRSQYQNVYRPFKPQGKINIYIKNNYYFKWLTVHQYGPITVSSETEHFQGLSLEQNDSSRLNFCKTPDENPSPGFNILIEAMRSDDRLLN